MKSCPLSKELAACRHPGDYMATGSVWTVHVRADQVEAAIKAIADQGYFLEDVMGLDAKEGVEVIYHFDHFEDPGRVTLRVLTPRDKPVVASIAHIFPGAEWHERETRDFYGIDFVGNPNPAPLLLAEDMTFHPLLKAEADRISVYQLLPTYDIADCRPVFLPEPPAAAETPAKSAPTKGAKASKAASGGAAGEGQS